MRSKFQVHWTSSDCTPVSTASLRFPGFQLRLLYSEFIGSWILFVGTRRQILWKSYVCTGRDCTEARMFFVWSASESWKMLDSKGIAAHANSMILLFFCKFPCVSSSTRPLPDVSYLKIWSFLDVCLKYLLYHIDHANPSLSHFFLSFIYLSIVDKSCSGCSIHVTKPVVFFFFATLTMGQYQISS